MRLILSFDGRLGFQQQKLFTDLTMELEGFIDLGSNHESENDGRHHSHSVPSEVDCQSSPTPSKADILNGEYTMGHDEGEDDQHLRRVGLDSILTPQRQILQESFELVESIIVGETVNVIKPRHDEENGSAVTLSVSAINNSMMDESPVLGVKRARMTCVDQQPSVRVIYNSLTRESKRKLNELLQQWSEWHAQHISSSSNSLKEALEYGEETYFPALHVGAEKPSTVSFWMDSQARIEEIEHTHLDSNSVPLYDRGYVLGSASHDGSAITDRPLEASRCFNCGSYSHSLKECSKPRDNVAISNARKMHNSKRNATPGTRVQTRYYQNTPGKYDDLRAGILGAETRECLGIGEFDPPPWLNRMRELGYPPGYLDVEEDEDQPSGITIFGDEEIKLEVEEGELPEKSEPELPGKKMTVDFPGINAPIPENADHILWAAASSFRSDPSKSWSHHRPNRSSESHRGHYHDQRRSRDYRDDAPPGTDYAVSSPGPGYSPRYSSPYDYNPIPRSPSLGRSLSDRGWRSPLAQEGSPSQSPHMPPSPYSSGFIRHSPQQPYSAASASSDHWTPQGSPYTVSSDMSSQRRERQDHHRHHHQNQRR